MESLQFEMNNKYIRLKQLCYLIATQKIKELYFIVYSSKIICLNIKQRFADQLIRNQLIRKAILKIKIIH